MSIFAQHFAAGTVSVPAVATVSFESLLNNIVEAHHDSVKVQGEIAQYAGLTASLEAIALDVEETLGQGGLTPQAAHITQTAVDNITKSFDMEESVVASMESFGGASDRESATEASLESMKETAKAAWDAIIKMIKTAIQKAKAFFAKVFDATPKLKKEAQALAEKARGLSGDAKEKKIKIGGAAKLLAVDKAVDPAKVVAGVKELAFESDGKIRGVAADGTLNEMGETVAAGDVSRIKGYEKIADKLIDKMQDGHKEDPRWPGILTATMPLPLGNKVLVSYTGKGSAEGTGAAKITALFNIMAKSKCSIEDKAKDFKHIENDAEVPTMSIADIENVAESLISFADETEKSRQDLEKKYKRQDEIAASLEKLKAGAEKVEDADKAYKPALAAYGRAAVATSTLMTECDELLNKYSMSTAGAALVYGKASAAQYSK